MALGFVAGVTPKSHFSVVDILDGLFSSRGKRKRETGREEGMEKGKGKKQVERKEKREKKKKRGTRK